MKSFWQTLPRPFTVLAPMEAVTDIVFRDVIRHAASPEVFFTEFTNATGWAHAGARAVGQRLTKKDNESPLVAQLWGADPAAMAKLASYCAAQGFDGVDLNTGCPDSHALKSGSGAALIKNPPLTASLIDALKSSGLPVSVKCRLGYSRVEEYKDWIRFLLEQNIEVLTIHLRTKKEMSKVPAHWEVMKDIVRLRDEIAPHTLVVGNGDVADRQHGEELARQTGCDGVMIGRGVFHNPYAFETIRRPHSRHEMLQLLHTQLDLFDIHSQRPFETLKRFFKIYIRDFEGAAELRDKLMHTSSTDEVRRLI